MQLNDTESDYNTAQEELDKRLQSILVCNVCYKSFSSKGSLNRHKLVHTGERRYKCTVCSRTFTRNEHLQRHLQRGHSETRSQWCEKCKMYFSNSVARSQHEAEAHCIKNLSTCSPIMVKEPAKLLDTEKLILHQCSTCGKKFRRKQHLRRHEKIHLRKSEESSVCLEFENSSNDIEYHNQKNEI